MDRIDETYVWTVLWKVSAMVGLSRRIVGIRNTLGGDQGFNGLVSSLSLLSFYKESLIEF